MKLRITSVLAILLLLTTSTTNAIVVKDFDWRTEKLNRGLVVIPKNSGNFVSWRMLLSDDENTSFDVLRNGEVIAKNLFDATSFSDPKSGTTFKYQIVTKQKGVPVDTTEAVKPWATKYYMSLQLDVPANGSYKGSGYSYSAGDCSVGDVDGDGEYEIFVKWDPNNQKDNSQSGYTGPCLLDCYKLNGQKLWRIDLGHNIRTGAHYTQYMVYDFDGDGLAELICKTAPGSKDALGKYVTSVATETAIRTADNTKEYANGDGHILSGPEYLTVFKGNTGAAIHTIYYNPNRAGGVGGAPNMPEKSYWGDNYGNRGERYLACVAFLQGPDQNPSAVMVRGYYTRCFMWAVDFDGSKLKTRWLHHGASSSQYTLKTGTAAAKTYAGKTGTGSNRTETTYGNGNHNLFVADVDYDGKDEIILGSSVVDHDGRLLSATGMRHGDALHVGDMDPDRPGLEMFQCLEEKSGWIYSAAEDSKVLKRVTGSGDTGRCCAADIYEGKRGYEMWAANNNDVHNVDGSIVGTKGSQNFRIYWDGDLLDELLDGGNITKFQKGDVLINGKKGSAYGSSCNGSKSTPNISCDLFGDWREELVLHNSNSLIILSTTEPTDYRVPCLMTDHTYRMAIAWQNCCYNQPPHLGYYLPDRVSPPKIGFTFYDEALRRQTVVLGDSIKPVKIHFDGCTSVSTYRTYLPDGSSKTILLPDGWNFDKDVDNQDITLTGLPQDLGTYMFVIRSVGQKAPEQFYDTIYVDVISQAVDIDELSLDNIMKPRTVYDLVGRKISTTNLEGLKPGIYVIDGKKVFIK